MSLTTPVRLARHRALPAFSLPTSTVSPRSFSSLIPTYSARFLPTYTQPLISRQKRHASSTPSGVSESGRGLRISHVFGGLVGLGMLVTIYGLLEWYFSLQTWPEPIRTPLKAALKAKNRGDIDRAENYFRKAIDAARSLPPSVIGPDPLLKLSGIYISLSSMLELDGQPVKAYSALLDALSYFGSSPLAAVPAPPTGWVTGEGVPAPSAAEQATPTSGSSQSSTTPTEISGPYTLTGGDITRAIGISQKLGQLALQLSTMPRSPPYPIRVDPSPSAPKSWDVASEHFLSSALTAMLRLGLSQPRSSTTSSSVQSGTTSPVVAGRDVDLPRGPAPGTPDADADVGRVDIRGLGMTMESLAEVHARKGQQNLAGQLLIQAVSTLLPPGSEGVPPISDRCRAALLMTTISSHALEPRTVQAIKASKSWSLRSLQIADAALAESGLNGSSSSTPPDAAAAVCARARSVGLYNLGMLAELENDNAEAIRRFNQALASARDTGFNEGKREATEALRRLKAA